MADVFELKFMLSESRFCQAHRRHLRRALLTVKNLFLVTTALAIGAVQAQLFGGTEWVLRIFVALWAGLILLFLLVYVRMPAKIYRRHADLAGEHRIRADQAGLDWEIGGVHKKLGWAEIARATDDPDYIYIHPRHGLPWIIPKDAFESDRELQAFDAFFGRMIFSGRPD